MLLFLKDVFPVVMQGDVSESRLKKDENGRVGHRSWSISISLDARWAKVTLKGLQANIERATVFEFIHVLAC